MNGDVWRTRGGQIGAEVARQVNNSKTKIKLALPGQLHPRLRWFDAEHLKREPARYEGARGGRA